MLDFRRSSGKAPDYLRGHHKRVLMLIVALLGMGYLIASLLVDPARLARLAGRAPQPGGEALDTRLRPDRLAQGEPGAFTSRGQPAGQPLPPPAPLPGVAAEDWQQVSSALAEVRDDTMSRAREQRAFFGLLAILQQADDRELRRAAAQEPAFVQLFRQPDEYRGRLVTIRGTARAVYPLEAPPNDIGISDYYQVWIQPADNRAFPLVVFVLELPAGFPAGRTEQLAEEVEFTGFFFKRWAYRAKDDLRTAPLLLARTLRWQPAPEPPADAAHLRTTLAFLVALVVLGGIVLALLYARLRLPALPAAAAEPPPDFSELEAAARTLGRSSEDTIDEPPPAAGRTPPQPPG